MSNFCDLCGEEQALYDGKTVAGAWANMCNYCFNEHGIGLGVGKGQLIECKAALHDEDLDDLFISLLEEEALV